MKRKRILITLCRVLLGLMFVASGLAKGIDPTGSSLKIGEYMLSFGLDFMQGYQMFLAILLSTVETVMGLMLLFGIYLRYTAALSSILMLFFTLFTLLVALTNPVADCGCFGDVFKMSNWASFFKNALILLPLSITVMMNAWMKPRVKKPCSLFWIVLFAAISSGISIYTVRHLPLIDFLPYSKGVNITRMIHDSQKGSDDATRVLYREISSGKVVEFSLSDTTWYDSSRWEYVDTIVAHDSSDESYSAENFAILDAGEDITLNLLERDEVLFLLCVTNPNELDQKTIRALCDAAHEANLRGYRIIAVTPVSLGKRKEMIVDQSLRVEYFNIDDVTLKTLMRAKYGLVVLRNGTIIDKMNSRDIPHAGEFKDYKK